MFSFNKKFSLLIVCFLFLQINAEIKHVIINLGGAVIPLDNLFAQCRETFRLTEDQLSIHAVADKSLSSYLRDDLGLGLRDILPKARRLWKTSTAHTIQTGMNERLKEVFCELKSRGYGISVVTSINQEAVEQKIEEEGLGGVLEYASAGNKVMSFLYRERAIRGLLRRKHLEPRKVCVFVMRVVFLKSIKMLDVKFVQFLGE